MDLWKDMGETFKALAGTWAASAALASAVLYLVGYLSLRFYVTTLGLATDLAVLDERYLFAGAQFLVTLVLAVPIMVLIALVVSALAYAPYRLMAARRSMKPGDAVKDRWDGIRLWWSAPHRLALTGIVISVAMIQLVMRQCLFFIDNLLVAKTLPEPAWLQALLLTEDKNWPSLYFVGLIVGTAGPAGLLLWAWSRPGRTSLSRLLSGLLAFLVAVQLLLLPINHGVLLSAARSIPQVMTLDGEKKLEHGQTAWLIWEGKESITYLLRTRVAADQERRELVTLQRSKVKQIRIICYDPILRVLFEKHSPCAWPHAERGKGSSPRQHYLYIGAEFTQPCLVSINPTSNHATQRQEETTNGGEPKYANLWGYDEPMRSAQVRSGENSDAV